LPTQIIIAVPVLKQDKQGVVTASDNEQEIVRHASLMKFSGYIDLSNMEGGDTVVVRQYLRIRKHGEYKKYAEETYVGVQENPIIYVTTKILVYGVEITIQQTTGTFKSFDYTFTRED